MLVVIQASKNFLYKGNLNRADYIGMDSRNAIP